MFNHRSLIGLPVLFAGLFSLVSLPACDGSDPASTGGGGSGGGGAAGGSGGSTMPATVEPSAETETIWTQIQGYSSWPKLPENATPVQSMAHKNMYVVTYHNDVVADAIAANTLPLPDGALLVKDNLAAPGDAMPMAVTVMAKQGGSWYWIQATPNGKVMIGPDGKPLEGDVAMCTGCHMGASDNDSVFTHDFTP